MIDPDNQGDDPLAPAKGIRNAIILAAIFWAIVGLVWWLW